MASLTVHNEVLQQRMAAALRRLQFVVTEVGGLKKRKLFQFGRL